MMARFKWDSDRLSPCQLKKVSLLMGSSYCNMQRSIFLLFVFGEQTGVGL